MKKITLLLLLFAISFSGYAQLTEDFETDSPTGWTFMQTETDDPGWVQTTVRANSGAASFFHDDANIAAESTSWMISPAHTVSADENLSFFYNNNFNSYSVESGVWVSNASGDPIANPSDFSEVFDIDANFSEDVWVSHEYDLSSYVGQTIYVAFKYRGDYADEVYIDDFSIAAPPSCVPPSSLLATTNSPSEVEISWTAGGTETEWTYEFGPTGFTQGSGTLTVTGPNNPVTLVGLTPGAAYDIYVQANCGGTDGNSTWELISWTMPNTPPSNDDCDGAIALTVNSDYECAVVTAGTTLGATASSQSDDVTGTPNTDVWFSFIATGPSHKVTITDVVNQGGGTSTSTDMGMGVYDASGGCDGLVFVDDSDPNTLDLSGLTPSNVYLVRVYGWYSSVQQNNFNICIGSPLGTVTPNFSDDFSTLNNWTEAAGDYGTPSGTTGSFAGDDFGNDVTSVNGQSARVNIYGSITDEYLISPVFDLSGGTYYLNYDIALTEFAATTSATLGTDDYLALLVTQDGGSSWQELSRWDASTEISNEGQSATEIPLSSYGAEVQFAFYANSGDSDSGIDNDLFIDNFQITSETLGTATNTLEGFTLYPTIVKEELNFRSQNKVEAITVFNLLGQKVFSRAPNANNSSVNLSTLRPGVYIVKVSAEGNIGSYKIIKE
ncbi:MAG: choice-of-anchor J domain-containing protein [Flavobacteriaceae bacterium]|jgi:hypothetical protein